MGRASKDVGDSVNGDGWHECACGATHWGRYGAAGLLAVRQGSGTLEVLLQHRAPWSHNGDTWGLPGGALNRDENATEGALREAFEEVGLAPHHVVAVEIFVDDHGSWSYSTVIARTSSESDELALNHESLDARWVEIDQVTDLDLHPSFARAWLKLKTLMLQIDQDPE